MSIAHIQTLINGHTEPESGIGLIAAILALAVEDLKSPVYHRDAYRFLYSGQCDSLLAALGVDYNEFRAELERHKHAKGIQRLEPQRPKQQIPRRKVNRTPSPAAQFATA